MNSNIRRLSAVVTRFSKEYFPNAYTVLLSGSLMDDKIHEKSDLDVIIFVSDQDQSYNEDFIFWGVRIQAIFISMRQLPIILQQDYLSAQGNQISMIAKQGTMTYLNMANITLSPQRINNRPPDKNTL